jgi:hypothetical protein
MVTISRDSVRDTYVLDLLGELHIVKDKLSFLEARYKMSFDAFERKIRGEEEGFASWDDYIEWKAYAQSLKDLTQKLEEVKSGHFTVA